MLDVVFDLEATCWTNRAVGPNETIEIGAVMIDSGEEISSFDAFVKPKIHPILSDFCKNLTSIEQEDVDGAFPFPDIFEKFVEWCGDCHLWSWGLYDRNQLERDALLHGGSTSFLLGCHYNLKEEFSRRRNIRRKYGMKKAMHLCGIPMTGTHHRGIDDARNISKIFTFSKDKWWYQENSIPT